LERTQTQTISKNDLNDGIASAAEVIDEIRIICSSKEKLNKFTHITQFKIKSYFDADNINGENGQDVLQNIFKKFLTKERKWYKNNGRTFENQLIMTITSYIRNEYKKYFEPSDPDKCNDEKNKTPKFLGIYSDNGETIEKYLIDKSQDFEAFDRNENEILVNDMEANIQKCYLMLEHDEEAFCVFDELLKVGNSDIKVAKNLGMTIENVRKTKKRIRRAANKIGIKNLEESDKITA